MWRTSRRVPRYAAAMAEHDSAKYEAIVRAEVDGYVEQAMTLVVAEDATAADVLERAHELADKAQTDPE